MYLKLGKYTEALQDVSAAVKLMPTEIALYRKGYVLVMVMLLLLLVMVLVRPYLLLKFLVFLYLCVSRVFVCWV